MTENKRREFRGCSNCGNSYRGRCAKGHVFNSFKFGCPGGADWTPRVKRGRKEEDDVRNERNI